MTALEYADFDLLIEQESGGGYRVQVLDSPTGPTDPITFATPWASADELPKLLAQLGQTRTGSRSAPDSMQRQAALTLGKHLFDAIFTGDIRDRFDSSLIHATDTHTGLRVKLRLENAGDLSDAPWEYLYDTEHGQFLVLTGSTPVVRNPAIPKPVTPLKVDPPLRVLVAISRAAPPRAFPLDVEKEWGMLWDRALGDARRDGLVALDRVAGNLSEINRALERGAYHAFHYVGHSDFDPASQDGLLWLEDANGAPVARSGNDLAQILGPHRTLGLAVFNSCEGARASTRDPYAGVAMSLVQKGVPAVIAMQFAITDDAAIAFSREFYSAIARGDPVDGAIDQARRFIFTSNNDVEWGTPVLFLRAPDGEIFEREELSPARLQRLRELAAEYEDGQVKAGAGDWAAAGIVFERLAAEVPPYLDSADRPDEARRHATVPQGPAEPAPAQPAPTVPAPTVPAPAPATAEPEPDVPPHRQYAGWLVAVILIVALIAAAIAVLRPPTP